MSKKQAEVFDEKCKNCSCEMEHIHEYKGCYMNGYDFIYWCPDCGTIVSFFSNDSSPLPQDDEWKYPKTTGETNA